MRSKQGKILGESWGDLTKEKGQMTEGERRRPRHPETMKGADTGETLRGAGNKL